MIICIRLCILRGRFAFKVGLVMRNAFWVSPHDVSGTEVPDIQFFPACSVCRNAHTDQAGIYRYSAIWAPWFPACRWSEAAGRPVPKLRMVGHGGARKNQLPLVRAAKPPLQPRIRSCGRTKKPLTALSYDRLVITKLKTGRFCPFARPDLASLSTGSCLTDGSET